MTTARVVSTASSILPESPLPVGTSSPLVVDQQGRLVVSSSNAIRAVASSSPSGGVAVAPGDTGSIASDLQGKLLVAPSSLAGVKTQLVAPDTPCAASGAWASAGVVPLDGGSWRRLRLLLDLDAQAVGNVVSLIVLGAFTAAAPAATDDEWFALGVTDGSWSSVTLSGALPSGTDFTITPNWFGATVRGSVLQSPAVGNVNDELRIACPAVDVTGVRYFQVIYAESGVPATPSRIGLWYTLSV